VLHMIDEETLEKIAKVVIKALALKEGDHLFIRSGVYNYKLAEKIAIEAMLIGAMPLVNMRSDDFLLEMHQKVPEKYLKQTPQHIFELVKKTEAYVAIEHPKDPSINQKFPPNKVKAAREGFLPIREYILTRKKWVYVGYPSEEAANFYGISYDELERLIIGGILIDYDELRAKCELLKSKLINAETVHITDEYGTDLTLKIRGRRINLDDGIITEEDVKVGDLGLNLPAGEVFIAPHETEGEGKLFVPLTRDYISSRLIKNLTLVFENGRLNIDKSSAEEGFEYLKQSLQQSIEIDKAKYGENIRTLNFAELGIGLNPHIDKAIGYILTDEKIGGSVHIAIGENRGYGGTSASSLHWDFVSAPKETIEVKYIDGTTKVIMENGKIVEE